MLIYEVNVNVNTDVADEFFVWLKGHIRDIIALDGFIGAEVFERDSECEQTATRLWTTHYFLKDRAVLDDYLQNHAPTFRQDGLDRFGDQFTATRRVLTTQEKF